MGAVAGRGEEVDRVAVALGLEELPHGAHLHEARGLLLDLFDVVEQFERLLFVLGEGFFEIAFVAEMAAVDHEGIDVAPHLGEVGHVAHAAIEVGRGRNRQVGADFAAAARGHGPERFRGSFDHRRCFRERVAGEHGVALRRVHQAVHQAQPGHGILGVAHGLAVGGRDAGARESLGERGAADQHRRQDSCGFEVRRGDDHLLRALDQQAGQADGVGRCSRHA